MPEISGAMNEGRCQNSNQPTFGLRINTVAIQIQLKPEISQVSQPHEKYQQKRNGERNARNFGLKHILYGSNTIPAPELLPYWRVSLKSADYSTVTDLARFRG